ncbi:L,D-transpeptidase [Thermoactinospora rubra]|uniref:L,D-transpeptidase n=1 Tax=Thermoactinospora rubra TaxID=1088767 RepID=UPI001F0B096F|nr:Ig-like domain-containing protein [Thermoactinospora rubra]
MRIAPGWRKPVAGVAIIVAAALTASCSGEPATTTGLRASGQTSAPATPAGPTIKISPEEGSAKVAPDKRVVVAASGGPLDEVVVESEGTRLEGAFNAERTKWVSKTPLKPSTRYTVQAKAGASTQAATFTTRKPDRELRVVDVTPAVKGEKVGVGAPIIVRFNTAVTDKKSIERALQVEAEKPVEGAWRWIDDTTVIYRTAKFWPAHQKVRFTAAITGVRGGKGLYGVADTTKTITIGARQIATLDVREKVMYVRHDGKLVKTMKVSAGMGTTREYTTTSGVHLTMEAVNPVWMESPGRKKGDPGYYRVLINHAVRISNSGEYVHAKDNVWAQGRRNVSHGCINARPDQAKWFYENNQRGDVVIIKGTDRKLEWNNGWGFWQMPFKEWKKGSALH